MRRISSRQNALVAAFRAAAVGDLAGRLLLDGAHLVGDALSTGLTIREVLVAADALDHPEVAALIERLMAAGVSPMAAAPSVMSAVSPVRSAARIVAIADRPPATATTPTGAAPVIVIACDIQDPGNLGAIIRVAEAAGAQAIVAAGACADPFGWKALRGSMGSALRVPIQTEPSIQAAVDRARTAGFRVHATVPRSGHSPHETPLTGKIALLIGGEGAGLPPSLVAQADNRITIPMQPPVESLNAAVTAAIVLYEARRQRA